MNFFTIARQDDIQVYGKIEYIILYNSLYPYTLNDDS